MDNTQNNIEDKNFENDKFSKVKNRRDFYKEKIRISNLINESENKKSILLMEMGVLTYQKIRDNYLCDNDFKSMSNEIFELDRLIYNRNLELEKLKSINAINHCECGNEIKNQDKFCSVCGKKVEESNDIKMTTCNFCDVEIELDSNYCVCCGKIVVDKQ
ncbi:MAG: zinc ribbon domain-containing protein [Terrisporobacter sp.]